MPSPDPEPTILPTGDVPRHIAIIMDGNGRWAQSQGKERIEGHIEGARSVREVVTSAREIGVEALTLYAFSVQNWGRPDDEIARLMELLFDYLASERETIMKNGIRLQGIGQTERLPPRVRERLRALESESKNNRDMVLSLALSYGGREEIVRAVRAVAALVESGSLGVDEISESLLDREMYTAGLPQVDLLIRTSGEHRLSNFLLWQSAYAELVTTTTHWPDFGESALFDCILDYRRRERRFGLTSAQIERHPC